MLLLLVILTACGGGYADRQMNLADSLMEENPDSAYILLTAIDSAEIKSDKNRARYALLTTQARIKTDQFDLSDTCALPLLDYYNNHGNDFDRMRAAFYKAEIYGLTENQTHQIILLNEANEIAIKNKDKYWQAKILEKKADIYHSNHCYSKAIDYRKEVVRFYHEAGKIQNERYSLLDLGLANYSNRDTLMAMRIIDSVMNIAVSEHDSTLFRYGLDYKLYICASGYDYVAADSLINNYYPEEPMFDDIYFKINTQLALGKVIDPCIFDELKLCISNDADRARYYWLFSKYCFLFKPDESVCHEIDSMVDCFNQVTYEVLQQPIIMAESDYNKTKAERNEHRSKRMIFWLCFGIVLLVLIVALLMSLLKIRTLKSDELIHHIKEELAAINDLNTLALNQIKIKDEEINRINESVISERKNVAILTSQLNEEVLKNKSLQNSIDKGDTSHSNFIQLLKCQSEQWEHISRICTSYFNSSEQEKKSIRYSKVLNSLACLANENYIDVLVLSINVLHDNIIEQIKSCKPSLDNNDLNMFALSFAGTSIRIISVILNKNQSSLYYRRDRIISEIRKIDSTLADKILNLLATKS